MLICAEMGCKFYIFCCTCALCSRYEAVKFENAPHPLQIFVWKWFQWIGRLSIVTRWNWSTFQDELADLENLPDCLYWIYQHFRTFWRIWLALQNVLTYSVDFAEWLGGRGYSSELTLSTLCTFLSDDRHDLPTRVVWRNWSTFQSKLEDSIVYPVWHVGPGFLSIVTLGPRQPFRVTVGTKSFMKSTSPNDFRDAVKHPEWLGIQGGFSWVLRRITSETRFIIQSSFPSRPTSKVVLVIRSAFDLFSRLSYKI